MPKSKTCLLDVNVWLALAFDRHIHHPISKSWFAELEPGEAAFCRITQMGFLRLITNHRVMGSEVMSQRNAWTIYEELAQDTRVTFVPELAEVEAVWKRYTQASVTGTNLWTDAYLAAMANVCGLRLVTFDLTLSRVKDVQTLLLGG